MASDSSDSPLILTPESTGTSVVNMNSSPDSSVASASAAKKSRRQTAFYPNVNSTNKPQKPFSRSAAKRESVMALGSIEHLQHYFTKTGLAAKKNPLDKPHHGLVPAIGGKGHVPTSPSITSLNDFQMPPSPAVPSPPRPIFPPHVKAYEVDPESLLPGVIEDLISVAHAWKLEKAGQGKGEAKLQAPFDVLEVLKTTTRAIRSTRNYLLSLPDESAGTIRAQFRPKILGPGAHTQPSASSASTSSTNVTSSGTPSSSAQGDSSNSTISEPIALIRRSALEVLTVLRQLEENCRLPLSDDAYDAQSDGGHSRGATGAPHSPSNDLHFDLPPDEPSNGLNDLEAGSTGAIDPDASIAFSLVQVQGRYESVPVWEDEEDAFALEQREEELRQLEKKRKDGWDERLFVLGNGWLYKQDVTLGDLGKERGVVGAYLDVVDEILFEGKPEVEERGWEKVRRLRAGRASSRAAKNRRVSAGDTEGRSFGLGLPEATDGGRRRVSTGMVNIMQGMSLSEEPEGDDNMDDIREEVEEGNEHEEVDDDELPEWARRSAFIDDRLGRIHALISAFLPAHLLSALCTPNSRIDLLTSLSSGQLLCVAYNSCVRKSKKPWGFVSKDGVHDILALEAAARQNGEDDANGKKVWTFRRTDNLRLWAGALKLRYMIPIQTPSQPQPQPLSRRGQPILSSSISTSSAASTPLSSPSATAQRFQLSINGNGESREPPILFDARVVARRDDGWDEMLESVLFRWVDKVVEEWRIHQ